NSQVQAIQNAAVANVYGLQLGMDVKLPKGFGFSANANYQIGEEELDDGSTSPSRHAAPFFGIGKIYYGYGYLNLQFYGVYQAEKSYNDLPAEEQVKDDIYVKDSDGNNYAPSWYTLNFKAMYQFDHFRVSAGIENITDQRYRSYG